MTAAFDLSFGPTLLPPPQLLEPRELGHPWEEMRLQRRFKLLRLLLPLATGPTRESQVTFYAEDFQMTFCGEP